MRMVLQQSEQDCLLACYAMVLDSWRTIVNPGELRGWRPLPADGLGIGALDELNESFRMQMVIRRVATEADLDQVAKFRGPVIVHWSGNHYVVVQRVGRRHVTIVDPGVGRIKLSRMEFLRNTGGLAAFVVPLADYRPVRRKRSNGPALLTLFGRFAVAAMLISLLLFQGATLLSAGTVQQVVGTDAIPPAATIGLLSLVIALIAASVVTRFWGQTAGTSSFDDRFSTPLFGSVLAQRLSFFRAQSIGGLIEKVNLRFVLRDTMLSAVLPSALSAAAVVSLLAYLAVVCAPLAGVVLLCSLLYVSLSLLVMKRQQGATQSYVLGQVEVAKALQETLQDVVAVKATGAEQRAAQSWSMINRRATDAYRQVLATSGVASGLQTAYLCVTLVGVSLAGIGLVASGQLTLADLVLFQTAVGMFASMLSDVQVTVAELLMVSVYRERQSDLWRPMPAQGNHRPAGTPGEITARSVAVTYPGASPVFEGIDLNLRAGDRVGVFGPSGVGKSSLLLALLGLIDFDGEIRVGDADFRRHTGVHFPGSTLQEGTVRGNLVSDGDVGDERLWQALQVVDLADHVQGMPRGLDSAVLTGGANFSTGQVQRLLLARSLVRGTQFLFWDEPMSGLDPATKRTICQRIFTAPEFAGTTFVIVSHDETVTPYLTGALTLTGDAATQRGCQSTLNDRVGRAWESPALVRRP